MHPIWLLPAAAIAFCAGVFFENMRKELWEQRKHHEDVLWRMGCNIESLKIAINEIQAHIKSHFTDPDSGGM